MAQRAKKDDQAGEQTTPAADGTKQPDPGAEPQTNPDAPTSDTVTGDTTNTTATATQSETVEERSERWNPETHGTPPADRPQRGDY